MRAMIAVLLVFRVIKGLMTGVLFVDQGVQRFVFFVKKSMQGFNLVAANYVKNEHKANQGGLKHPYSLFTYATEQHHLA